LGPLLIIRVKAGKLLEAGADVLIKVSKGSSVKGRGHHPERENHFTERTAVTQQVQSDLWVWKLAQSLQDLRSLSHSALGMAVAKVSTANGSAQQLKVTIPYHFEVGRELAGVNSGSTPSAQNELTLIFVRVSARAESEPQFATAGL